MEIADFGNIFIIIHERVLKPFFDLNISMFGFNFPVWGLYAWCIFAGLVWRFIRSLGE